MKMRGHRVVRVLLCIRLSLRRNRTRMYDYHISRSMQLYPRWEAASCETRVVNNLAHVRLLEQFRDHTKVALRAADQTFSTILLRTLLYNATTSRSPWITDLSFINHESLLIISTVYYTSVVCLFYLHQRSTFPESSTPNAPVGLLTARHRDRVTH